MKEVQRCRPQVGMLVYSSGQSNKKNHPKVPVTSSPKPKPSHTFAVAPPLGNHTAFTMGRRWACPIISFQVLLLLRFREAQDKTLLLLSLGILLIHRW